MLIWEVSCAVSALAGLAVFARVAFAARPDRQVCVQSGGAAEQRVVQVRPQGSPDVP